MTHAISDALGEIGMLAQADGQPFATSEEIDPQNFIGVVDGDIAMPRPTMRNLVTRMVSILSRLGVSQGDHVIVSLPVSWPWFVINGAIRAIGAVHVTMNWRSTPSEASHIVADSGGRIVLLNSADTNMDEALREAGAQRIITVEGRDSHSLFAQLVSEPKPDESDLVDLEDLRSTSMVVYTSGTTGRPKGALRKEPVRRTRELAEYQASAQYTDVLDANRRRSILLNMPLHHASGMRQAEVVVSQPLMAVVQRKFDAEDTLRIIDKYKITDWSAVPTMLSRIVGLEAAVSSAYNKRSLRKVTVGAAAVPTSLRDDFTELFGEKALLFENYGSTETSMICGLRPSEYKNKRESCGRPFRHVSIQIIDEEFNESPTGSIGEIWAHTPLTIDRYLNQGPLGPDVVDKDGRFRTGDMGYLDEDGYLFITGRTKDMIISGGTNIYPAEIEDILRQHPDVHQSAVIGVPDEELGEITCAVIEPKPGRSLSVESLEALTGRLLTAYKRPRQYIFTDVLPRNAMGKVIKHEIHKQLGTQEEHS